MDIVIYGIKEGFRVLYQTEGTPLSVVFDARVSRPDKASVGQSAYAVAAAKNGFAYTKYVIVNALADNNGTLSTIISPLAFTLYLPKEQKMAGSDIKELLDTLADEFCERFVSDGLFGKPAQDGTSEDAPEDWAFIDNLLAPFESKVRTRETDDALAMAHGEKEPAYFYYTSDAQLCYCLEQRWPYYQHYLQLIFVNDDLRKLTSNPLRSLRHDDTQDLTPKPTQNSTPTEETVQSVENEEVSSSTPAEETEITEIMLSLNIVDEMGNAIPQVMLIRQGDPAEIPFKSGMISFEGAEMTDRWLVTAHNGKLISDTFRPIDYAGQALPSVVLRMHRRKEVVFKVEDGKLGTELSGCTVKLNYNGTNEVVENSRRIFTGEELQRNYQLVVSHEGYVDYYEMISPDNIGNEFIIKMLKKEATTEEKPANGGNPFTGGEGYVQKDKKGTTIKTFLRILIVVFIIAIVGILIATSVYFFGNKENKIPPYIASERVTEYLNSNELNVNILASYLDSCKDAEVILLTEATPESEQLAARYVDLQDQLNRAISWRNAVNSGDIALVQNNYFAQDSSLYRALMRVSHADVDNVSAALQDPAARTADKSVPQLSQFVGSVVGFLDMKRKYERPFKDSLVADSTYRNFLNEVAALNLPELALVSNACQPICQHLGIDIATIVGTAEPETPSTCSDNNTTPAAKPEPKQPEVPTAQPKTEAEQFAADFWTLIHSGSDDFEAYKALRIKAMKLKSVSVSNCPELNYLHEMTVNYKNPTWQRFKSLTAAQRKNAKTVEEL